MELCAVPNPSCEAHHGMCLVQVCSGKGYYCELCGSEDVLYPFDRHASLCSVCHSIFHK